MVGSSFSQWSNYQFSLSQKFHHIRHERLAIDKCSLLDLFVSYEENEVLWIRLYYVFITCLSSFSIKIKAFLVNIKMKKIPLRNDHLQSLSILFLTQQKNIFLCLLCSFSINNKSFYKFSQISKRYISIELLSRINQIFYWRFNFTMHEHYNYKQFNYSN